MIQRTIVGSDGASAEQLHKWYNSESAQVLCDLQCQAGKISSEAIPPWKALEAARALTP